MTRTPRFSLGVGALSSALAGFFALASAARAALEWRVSVKVFVDRTNSWPSSTETYRLTSREEIERRFAEYNELLDQMGWGFHLRVTQITALSSNLSAWFDADPGAGGDWDALEAEIDRHRLQFRYAPDAINMYISNSGSRGVTTGRVKQPLLGDMILLGQGGYWSTALHEFGHAMSLCHTHGCGINACSNSVCPANDYIDDTIEDDSRWSLDDIAGHTFSGSAYSNLTAEQRGRVDDIWLNIMSYHSGETRDRLTRGQWDFLVDISNYQRFTVTSGRTRFVDNGNRCGLPQDVLDMMNDWGLTEADLPLNPFQWGTRNTTPQEFCIDLPPPGFPTPPGLSPMRFCSSLFCMGGPYKTLTEGLNRSEEGDRIQIKAGSYNEPMTIRKRITLATDRGSVFIGRP